ncbi:MAG: BTAD domain-containing putative transcriptional regulator, partial [Paracoccaceae bacterium]
MRLRMGLRVRMLGGFEVCRDPGGPVEIPARKARALLALLARRPGQALEREALAARLWPDAFGPNARTSLRQALKQLRRLFGGSVAHAIRSEGDSLVLDPALAEVDAVTFERLCGEGSPAALEQAAGLYQGDFLDGFVAPTDGIEEWLTYERGALRELAVRALTRLAEEHREADGSGLAVHAALRLLALDPLQEHVHRLLMRLYLDQGRRGDAAAQYRLCRDALRRELGVAPEPETERLYRSLREAAEAAPGAAIPDRPAVAVLPFRNLGEERGQDYFSDGLTEDIIAALTRWRSFPVTARHSSFAFRGRRFEVGEAGRELGARYLLEGSVRRHGARVRISVQLSDCETEAHLWAERYDRELIDIFEVQDDITRRIAATVAPELSRAELRRAQGKRPENLDAWDCVLRGMAKIHERTPEGNLEARALFRQAI